MIGTSSASLSDIISEFLINLINLALDKKIIANKPRLQTLVLGRENSTLSDLLTDRVSGKTDSIFDMSVVTGNVDLHAEEREESPAEKVSFKGDWVLETEELYSLINDQDMRVCKIVLFTEDLEFKIDKRGILSGFEMPELEGKYEDPSADLSCKSRQAKAFDRTYGAVRRQSYFGVYLMSVKSLCNESKTKSNDKDLWNTSSEAIFDAEYLTGLRFIT